MKRGRTLDFPAFFLFLFLKTFTSKPHRVNLFEGEEKELLKKPYIPDNIPIREKDQSHIACTSDCSD